MARLEPGGRGLTGAAFFKGFVATAPVAVAMFDREMRYVAASRRWLDGLRLRAHDIPGHSHYELFPETSERWRQAHRRGLAGETLGAEQDPITRTDGRRLWVRWSIQPWRDERGAVGGILVFTEDISHARAAQSAQGALSAVERRLRQALGAANAGIWEWDLAAQRMFWSDETFRLFGLAPRSIEASLAVWLGCVHAEDRATLVPALQHAAHSFEALQVQFRVASAQGRERILVCNGAPERGYSGEGRYLRGILVDITERRRAEEHIRRFADTDPVTGLPSRARLIDRLREAAQVCTRRGSHGALVLIDLDRFRVVEGSVGPGAGDPMLQEAARRIGACLRRSDALARAGGSTFMAVLTTQIAGAREAAAFTEDLARKILAALRADFVLEGGVRRCSASIGIALFRADPPGPEDLERQAALALERARAVDGGGVQFFEPPLLDAVRRRRALDKEIRAGLERGEFLPHYQPQVDSTGRVFGVEALARWQHPERGLLAPAHFLGAAEQCGLILPLGRAILGQVLRQMHQWRDSTSLGFLTVAVNLSSRQIQQADFVDQVRAALDASGADPGRLVLELTENTITDDADETASKMHRLKEMGLGFSVDDFGTGASSLAALKRLPLDRLKIDMSFVHKVHVDAGDGAIARAIVALGQGLGLGVIAEGVETQAQARFLREAGCATFQGNFFSPPLAPQTLEVQMRRSLYLPARDGLVTTAPQAP